MTEQMALKILNSETENISDVQVALKVARGALVEIQQYRAIGLTPELIEAMQGHNIAMINDLEAYQAIGTVEELQALKEKSVAKKPIEKIYCGGLIYGGKCPTCQAHINSNSHWKYCKCGQYIDWK